MGVPARLAQASNKASSASLPPCDGHNVCLSLCVSRHLLRSPAVQLHYMFIAVVCSSQGSCVDLGASVAVVTMNTNCNSCGMCGDCSEKDYWIRRGECEMLKLLKLLGRTATVFLPDVPSMRAA